MSEEIKLKPCPFCGNDGSGSIEHALHICFSESHTINIDGEEFHQLNDEYSVQCDKCTATMGPSFSREDAAEAWNTRHGDSNE